MAKPKKVKREIPVKLPEGVLPSDLDFPKHPDNSYESFELISTERFGWVVATLHIRNAGRRSSAAAQSGGARTYAVSLSGGVCTVGLGPHVKARHTVYVKKSRREELQKFLDLRDKGSEDANAIRDRISSRRANSILRRPRDPFGY